MCLAHYRYHSQLFQDVPAYRLISTRSITTDRQEHTSHLDLLCLENNSSVLLDLHKARRCGIGLNLDARPDSLGIPFFGASCQGKPRGARLPSRCGLSFLLSLWLPLQWGTHVVLRLGAFCQSPISESLNSRCYSQCRHLETSDRAFETYGTCSGGRDSMLAPRWMQWTGRRLRLWTSGWRNAHYHRTPDPHQVGRDSAGEPHLYDLRALVSFFRAVHTF